MDSCALSMHYSLRNALPIELGQLIDEVMVLEQKGAKLACRHGVLVVVHRDTHGGGHLLRHLPILIIKQGNKRCYFKPYYRPTDQITHQTKKMHGPIATYRGFKPSKLLKGNFDFWA